MKKSLIYKDEKSDKFWTVQVSGKVLTVIFGKTGTAGRTNIKEFETAELARKEADKLIKEKVKKGYMELIGAEPKSSNIGLTEFWNLIERAKKKSAGDVEEQAQILNEILTERPIEDIVEFGKIFDYLMAVSYRSDLWAAAYIIQGGCSDDMFDYFRAWVISQGKEAFEATLENPETLAKIINPEDVEEVDGECMLYIAQEAYENKTGGNMNEFFELEGHVNFPEIELDWKENDLEKMFPKLCQKYLSNPHRF
jgi:predicted DNA-binding WGR domain protein